LPQEVVSQEVWEEYANQLQEIVLDEADSEGEIENQECEGGACPIK